MLINNYAVHNSRDRHITVSCSPAKILDYLTFQCLTIVAIISKHS